MRAKVLKLEEGIAPHKTGRNSKLKSTNVERGTKEHIRYGWYSLFFCCCCCCCCYCFERQVWYERPLLCHVIWDAHIVCFLLCIRSSFSLFHHHFDLSQVRGTPSERLAQSLPAASGKSEENNNRHHLGKRPGTAQPNHGKEQPSELIDHRFYDWTQGFGAAVIRLEHDVWGRERLRTGARQWGYLLRRRCPLLTRRTGWLAGYRWRWCGSAENEHDHQPSRYPALPYVLYGWRVAYLTQVRVRPVLLVCFVSWLVINHFRLWASSMYSQSNVSPHELTDVLDGRFGYERPVCSCFEGEGAGGIEYDHAVIELLKAYKFK